MQSGFGSPTGEGLKTPGDDANPRRVGDTRPFAASEASVLGRRDAGPVPARDLTRDHGRARSHDTAPASTQDTDIEAILRKLDEFGDGPRAAARRRDIVELYNKLKAEIDNLIDLQSAPVAGTGASVENEIAAIRAELSEVKNAIHAMEGAVHISLGKAVDKAVRENFQRATGNARSKGGRRERSYLIPISLVTLVACGSFLLIVLLT